MLILYNKSPNWSTRNVNNHIWKVGMIGIRRMHPNGACTENGLMRTKWMRDFGGLVDLETKVLEMASEETPGSQCSGAIVEPQELARRNLLARSLGRA